MKRVSILFAWYDFWVGLFYDSSKKLLYFFPIPMIGVVVKLHKCLPVYDNAKIQYRCFVCKCSMRKPN